MSFLLPRLTAVLLLLFLVAAVTGHSGHDKMVQSDANEPIDGVLNAHMVLQLVTWGLILPFGMVLGLTRSRFHVPVQTLGILLTIVGVQLAHHHGGRSFQHSAHGTLAYFLTFYLIAQVGFGIFLKLHIMEGSKARRTAVWMHGLLGRMFPVLAWSQIVLGFVNVLQFCSDGSPPNNYRTQCYVHIVQGSTFQAYGIVLLLSIRFGGPWLAKRRVSQDYLDSCVLAVYGIVTVLNAHNGFGGHEAHWSHKDMQHTAVGVLMCVGGSAGIWLGRNAKRNVMPALVLGSIGMAMSSHEQPTMLATTVHRVFGLAFVLFAIARIVEISFLAQDDIETAKPSPFQYLSPLLMIFAGMTFMGAHREQLQLVTEWNMDHVTYTLLLLSASLLVFLWTNMLLSLYANSGRNAQGGVEFTLASMKRRFCRSGSMDKTDYASIPGMEEIRSP